MGKRIFRLFFHFSIALQLISCRFIAVRDRVELVFPELPPPGRDILNLRGWEVAWWGEDGSIKTLYVDSQDYLSVDIPREKAVPVLAYPRMAMTPFSPRPAGVVLSPASTRPLELPLSWEEGFAAEFLLKLAHAGFPLEGLNTQRFTEESLSRTDGRPWLLRENRLVEDLRRGELTLYSFQKVELIEVKVPALPSGQWFFEDLTLLPQELPGFDSWELPQGLSFFWNPQAACVAELWVEGDKVLLRLYEDTARPSELAVFLPR